MRGLLAFVFIGYMIGSLSYQYDPQVADFLFYKLVPLAISLDSFYVGFQGLNAHITAAQHIAAIHGEAQILYAELLPILGSYFLSKFNDLELISFYRQAIDNNIELSLESLESFFFKKWRSAESCALYFNLLIFTSLKSETRVLFLDKIENRVDKFENRVENIFIPKMFEVTFLTSI